MNWNLKNRITVPTVALIVVITATLSGVSFLKSRSILDNVLKTQLTEQCATSLVQVEDWMEAQHQNLMQLSVAPYIVSSLQDAPEGQSNRIVASAQLMQAGQLHPYYQEINLLDATGLSVSSSNPNSIGKLNLGDRQYFKDAFAGKTVISKVLASRTSGNPVVVVATPIKEGETVRGVLEISLDLNTFSSQFISSQKFLETGYAFLFDDQGIVIAHPDKTRIFKTKLADYDWGQKMMAMKSGEVRYVFADVDKSTIFNTSDTLHWGLGLTVPTAELNAPIYKMGKINLALSLGAVVLGMVMMFLTARSISRPLQKLADDLLAGAEQTTSSAAQVSTSSQSLAEGSGQQAASIEETSSSLEELASMTKRNADNSHKANELSKQTRSAADKGVVDMRAMDSAMQAIKVSSDDIAKIIKTIDEIAFQTNILALNAAVEAARAGEAGMGFAVVADEVRNLAQRSAAAAKETAAKIEGAISKTAQGVELSGKVSAALNDIVTKARQVDELAAEVAGASLEQTQGITQINTAVGQMDQVTQSNAATAEETAAAAEELNAQAETMKQSVAQLLELTGSDSRNNTAPPAISTHRGVPIHSARAAANRSGSKKARVQVPVAAVNHRRKEIPMESDFKNF